MFRLILPPKQRDKKNARYRPVFEVLEERRVLAAAFSEFLDPRPDPGNRFGDTVLPLSNGNVVITAPGDDAGGINAGAVYLFNGRTGELISTLRGSGADDQIGSSGVVEIGQSNFVVQSPSWNFGNIRDVGAATFVNGATGLNGFVSPSNSLVGGTASDQVGSKVVVLQNGNYLVVTPFWSNGDLWAAGAVSFGRASVGVSGLVNATNSLVGETSMDRIGEQGVLTLRNGNYVVRSNAWMNPDTNGFYAGAVTFGNGVSGTVGYVSKLNSLVGRRAFDEVGSAGVTELETGNFVVASPTWDASDSAFDVGAVTFANGLLGIAGEVNSSNSLIGSTSNDSVGIGGIVALSNGNYVVISHQWSDGSVTQVGAVTLGNGTTGIKGDVNATNSLIGSAANDRVGVRGVQELKSGNYVVMSPEWDLNSIPDVGAATFASGLVPKVGRVSASNSLVGSQPADEVSNYGVVPLANGNYVVKSPDWNNGAIADAGAVTLGLGSLGVAGAVSSANSLVGGTASDRIGGGRGLTSDSPYHGVTALTNGNYVVASPEWDRGSISDVGAVTFVDGSRGLTGLVTATNSLVGSQTGDRVGEYGITELSNGHYVVSSPGWDNGSIVDSGAVTLGHGRVGTKGVVSPQNSLVSDVDLGFSYVGSLGAIPLRNGNYVVPVTYWDNGSGAAVWGHGATGATGPINSSSALVGKSGDFVSNRGVVPLTNGNYLVLSQNWSNQIPAVGAVTFVRGAEQVAGEISSQNSLIGTHSNDSIGGGGVALLKNGNYLIVSPNWNSGAGAVTFGSGLTGVQGKVSRHNSALGTTSGTSSVRVVVDDVNEHFYAVFPNDNGGKVRVGSQIDGFAPTANPVFAFEQTSILASESLTAVDIAVTLSQPVGRRVSVEYGVTGGTALPVTDYSLLSGVLEFQPGEVQKKIRLNIVNDATPEVRKSIQIKLSNPTFAKIGAGAELNYVILDDDGGVPRMESYVSGRTLWIYGTEQADTVRVRQTESQIQVFEGSNLHATYQTFSVDSISIDTAGGNDQVSLSYDPSAVVALPSRIRGGTGDDALTGGRGIDSIDGGTGFNQLDGFEGADTLVDQGRLVLRPTILVLVHGFEPVPGSSIDNGDGSWSQEFGKALATAMEEAGSQTQTYLVEWDSTFSSNQNPTQRAADRITELVNNANQVTDVYFLGHSRGAIFVRDVGNKLGQSPKFGQIKQILIDPTAADLMGDRPGAAAARVVAEVYDDDYVLVPFGVTDGTFVVTNAERHNVRREMRDDPTPNIALLQSVSSVATRTNFLANNGPIVYGWILGKEMSERGFAYPLIPAIQAATEAILYHVEITDWYMNSSYMLQDVQEFVDAKPSASRFTTRSVALDAWEKDVHFSIMRVEGITVNATWQDILRAIVNYYRYWADNGLSLANNEISSIISLLRLLTGSGSPLSAADKSQINQALNQAQIVNDRLFEFAKIASNSFYKVLDDFAAQVIRNSLSLLENPGSAPAGVVKQFTGKFLESMGSEFLRQLKNYISPLLGRIVDLIKFIRVDLGTSFPAMIENLVLKCNVGLLDMARGLAKLGEDPVSIAKLLYTHAGDLGRDLVKLGAAIVPLVPDQPGKLVEALVKATRGTKVLEIAQVAFTAVNRSIPKLARSLWEGGATKQPSKLAEILVQVAGIESIAKISQAVYSQIVDQNPVKLANALWQSVNRDPAILAKGLIAAVGIKQFDQIAKAVYQKVDKDVGRLASALWKNATNEIPRLAQGLAAAAGVEKIGQIAVSLYNIVDRSLTRLASALWQNVTTNPGKLALGLVSATSVDQIVDIAKAVARRVGNDVSKIADALWQNVTTNLVTFARGIWNSGASLNSTDLAKLLVARSASASQIINALKEVLSKPTPSVIITALMGALNWSYLEAARYIGESIPTPDGPRVGGVAGQVGRKVSSCGTACIVGALNGPLSGATAFLDVNKNGTLEDNEPWTFTDSKGRFLDEVSDEFDANSNGVLDQSEGQWVIVDGVDLSTGQQTVSSLVVPLNNRTVTPLTSLIGRLVESHGLTQASAKARVQAAFGLPDVDFGQFPAVEESLKGNLVGSQVFRAHGLIQDTLASLSSLISSVVGAPSYETLLVLVQNAIDNEVADLTGIVPWDSADFVSRLISQTQSAAAVTIPSGVSSAASTVIADMNRVTMNIPLTANFAFLESMARAKTVSQTQVKEDLTAAAKGQLNPSDLLARNTMSQLMAKRNAVAMLPKLSVPLTLVVEATSALGAIVPFTVGATNFVGQSQSYEVSHPSGSMFGMGDTIVTVSAKNASGNATESESFTVRVIDTTAPNITPPNKLTVAATSPAGAFVTVPRAQVLDLVDPNPTVSYDVVDGVLPIGNHRVTIRAVDQFGNSSVKEFEIAVQDQSPPIFGALFDFVVESNATDGAILSFDDIVATDNVDETPSLSFVPSAGLFPIGTTTVTATARDSAGNTRETSFRVTVRDTLAPARTYGDMLLVEANQPHGALVSYPSNKFFDFSSQVSASYSVAEGFFPIGDTTVIETLRDSSGNQTQSSFVVRVVDTVPPQILNISDVIVRAESSQGTVVQLPRISAVDAGDPKPETGSDATVRMFKPGTTRVDAFARDVYRNESKSQMAVIVVPTTGSSQVVPAITRLPLHGIEGSRVVVEGRAISRQSLETVLNVLYEWKVYRDGSTTPVISSHGNGAIRFEFIPTDSGIYRVELTVSDSLGVRASDSATIDVKNEQPKAGFHFVRDQSPGLGIELFAEVADSSPVDEDTQFEFRWTIYRDDQLVANHISTNHKSMISSYRFQPTQPGLHVVYLTVVDKDGESDTHFQSIEFPGLSLSSLQFALNEDDVLDGALWSSVNNTSIAYEYEVIETPRQGTIQWNKDGAFQYQPNLNYFGPDQFVFRVVGGGDTRTATASLTIAPKNDAPTGLLVEGVNGPNRKFSGQFLVSDSDSTSFVYRIVDTSLAFGTVRLVDSAQGLFEYQPLQDFSGWGTIGYVVSDGALDSQIQYASIYTWPRHAWQNQKNPLDVDDDSLVTSLDVLVVVNRLNARGSGILTLAFVLPPYVDVNQDGAISALDVLAIINYLNSRKRAEGESMSEAEGESMSEAEGEARIDLAVQDQVWADWSAVGHDDETEDFPRKRRQVTSPKTRSIGNSMRF